MNKRFNFILILFLFPFLATAQKVEIYHDIYCNPDFLYLYQLDLTEQGPQGDCYFQEVQWKTIPGNAIETLIRESDSNDRSVVEIKFNPEIMGVFHVKLIAEVKFGGTACIATTVQKTIDYFPSTIASPYLYGVTNVNNYSGGNIRLNNEDDYENIEWEFCENNCSNSDGWDAENWTTIPRTENRYSIPVYGTPENLNKALYYRTKVSNNSILTSENPIISYSVCKRHISPMHMVTFGKFRIIPEKFTACPGEKIKINIIGGPNYDNNAENFNYKVYSCDVVEGSGCLNYRELSNDKVINKSATSFELILDDKSPNRQRIHIIDDFGNSGLIQGSTSSVQLATPYVTININPPATLTHLINDGDGLAAESCMYPGESIKLNGDICGAMADNPDDWEFSWQKNINGEDFTNIAGGFTDIVETFVSLTEQHSGVAGVESHTYRLAFKRKGETAPKLFSNAIRVKLYPSLLSGFTSFTRNCTQLFEPIINQEYTECQPYAYQWNFGDGTTGNDQTDKEPVHVYAAAGDYDVTLKVSYDCGCDRKSESITIPITHNPPPELFVSRFIDIPVQVVPKTIQASASSLTDVWDLTMIEERLISSNPWQNGLAGVWRQDATFVYKTDREYLLDASNELPISQAGTFELNMFNWNITPEFAVPGWNKVNTITNYSPYGFETENEDILGIYSAALYGTFGDFPLAVGQNTRELEMAYTGFESPEAFVNNTTKTITREGADLDLGNWLFGQSAPPIYEKHIVVAASDNLALVDEDPTALQPRGHYWVIGTSLESGRSFVKKANVVCDQRTEKGKVVLTFDKWLYKGLWKGKIVYREPATLEKDVKISNTVAHTGKHSFIVSGTSSFEQKVMDLEPGQEYYFSAWVSDGDPLSNLITNIQIEIWQNQGMEPLITLLPQGNIVNGWQQISGKFTAPLDNIEIKMISNGKIRYLDDVRLHPVQSNIKSYVYDMNYYRLIAELDENNFATFYEYDKSGALQVVKKETERGIITVQESITNTPQ